MTTSERPPDPSRPIQTHPGIRFWHWCWPLGIVCVWMCGTSVHKSTLITNAMFSGCYSHQASPSANQHCGNVECAHALFSRITLAMLHYADANFETCSIKPANLPLTLRVNVLGPSWCPDRNSESTSVICDVIIQKKKRKKKPGGNVTFCIQISGKDSGLVSKWPCGTSKRRHPLIFVLIYLWQ